MRCCRTVTESDPLEHDYAARASERSHLQIIELLQEQVQEQEQEQVQDYRRRLL